MNRGEITVDFDDDAGVLYIKRKGSHIKFSREMPDNSGIVLSYNRDGVVVGVIIIGADSMNIQLWKGQEGRSRIPQDLLVVIDLWIENR